MTIQEFETKYGDGKKFIYHQHTLETICYHYRKSLVALPIQAVTYQFNNFLDTIYKKYDVLHLLVGPNQQIVSDVGTIRFFDVDQTKSRYAHMHGVDIYVNLEEFYDDNISSIKII